MPTIDYTETLITCNCWCGIHLAIPSNLHRIAHDTGQDVYCPLGHIFTWAGSSYKQKLEEREAELARERQRLKATRDLLAAEERSHTATRGVVTRQKNHLKRVTNGVCPCCNRTFQNLGRHMKGQHPEFAG